MVAGLAHLPAKASEEQIRGDINETLAQYPPASAFDARTEFVTDRGKYRRAHRAVIKDLTLEQRRQVERRARKENRDGRAGNIDEYYKQLDDLCGGRHVWLPAGTEMPTVPENASDLCKIVRHVKKLGREPQTLWAPGGELAGVAYKKLPLDIAWKKVKAAPPSHRRAQTEPASEDAFVSTGYPCIPCPHR